MRKGKIQNSINIAKTFPDEMRNSAGRKSVNKKWSSFSFLLLQTAPDEKPNKGINSTENSFDTFSYFLAIFKQYFQSTFSVSN